jgi:brefeldin A-inhibited guanine nucleotide-exchange protein
MRLQVLFDILRVHGHLFSETFWLRVFEKMLFPIFDHVRSAEGGGEDGEAGGDGADEWLYDTCTNCLQFVVDLFVQFYQARGRTYARVSW